MAEDQAPELQAAPGRDVFISYASHDKAVAESVCKALERAGVVCWIAPRDVIPGESFAGAIVHAIDATKVIVLVLSEHSADSQHVLREVERASSRRHPVIAFRIDLAPMPADLEYFLNTSQWLDASAMGTARAMPKLVDAVKIALTQPPTVARANPVAPSIAKASRGRGLIFLVASAMIIATAAFVAANKVWVPSYRAATNQPAATPAVAISDKSIAVLPLANESGDPSQQYFSDGLSESLITALTQFPGLRVIGRTSAFQFRDSKEDAHSIGLKLGVARLLEGSVQRSGKTVRVRAALIDTADGSTQWSDRFDRPYKDLFALQDAITRAVAEALRAKLMPGEQVTAQTERPPGGNLEAYNSLLQGRFYIARDTEADYRKAIGFYTQATELDPRYALAWSALSRGWSRLGGGFLEGAAAQQAYAKARESADRALTLAPELAAAHIARGVLLRNADFDWRGAEQEFRRALALAPNDAESKVSFGGQLATFGKLGPAIELTRQALAIEPLRADWYNWLATFLSALNRLDEAEQAIRRAIELEPAAFYNYQQLVLIEALRGNAAAALAAAQQEPDEAWRTIPLALARQIGGDRTAADAAVQLLITKGADGAAYQIAQVYALRSDAKETFAWLNRAWSNRDPGISSLLYDPLILRFRNDPRFAAFCRKIGLPVPGGAPRG